MEYQTIIYTVNNAIGRIRLNRPDKLNAFSSKMIRELTHAINEVNEDDSVKVLIVSGEGRAFSAGVDLKETSAENFGADGEVIQMGIVLGNLLESMPKVTIAQIHGYCFTGALEVALMFDLLYCADDTQFGDTHAKWAIMPRWGMTQRLARRVGLNKAKELTFRSLRFTGIEAERMGLANRAFAIDELGPEVNRIAEDVLSNSMEAIGKIKKLYNEGYSGTLKEGLKLELDADPRLMDTDQMLNQFENKKYD